MPTYEYLCRSCGHQLEVVQKFSDAALDTCERCHGQLRKVYNPAGIIFKGSGYYVTDTRAGNGKAGRAPAAAGAKDSSGAASDGSASGSSSASDSKSPSDTSTSSAGGSSGTSESRTGSSGT